MSEMSNLLSCVTLKFSSALRDENVAPTSPSQFTERHHVRNGIL